MLNIEKYKEELENIGVINPNGLAVIGNIFDNKELLKNER